MKLKQLTLEIWRNEYFTPFLELNNIGIIENILNYNDSFVLIGSVFSGKKHLMCSILFRKKISCYYVNNLSDSEIISLYDQNKNNKEVSCWIVDNNLNLFSKDVQSRLKSLGCFYIKSLDIDSLKTLLVHRLSIIGVRFNEQKIRYCLERLPLDYIALEKFIVFIKGQSNISLKGLKHFFETI